MSRPSSGARYVLERVPSAGEPVLYRGFVHLPGADVPLEVRIEVPSGATTARLGPAEPPPAGAAELEKTAAALVRSATKAAVATGAALPRKIVRWREPRQG